MKFPLIFGHRGARYSAPENSIPSFENALKFGADGVELDVHLTKDGKLVVIHDSTLKRINGSNMLIRDLTFEDIKKLNIAHLIKEGAEKLNLVVRVFKTDKPEQFFVEVLNEDKNKRYLYLVKASKEGVNSFKKLIFPKRGALVSEKEIKLVSKGQELPFDKTPIPELSEALYVLKGKKVNIEIKRGEAFYNGIIDLLVKETESFGYDNILFSSFNYDTVKEMKRRYPFLHVNRLYEIPKNPLKAANGTDGVNPLFLLISKKSILKLHKNGKTVYPWVVNRAKSIVRFMLQETDGIITDRPYYAVRIREELKDLLNEVL